MLKKIRDLVVVFGCGLIAMLVYCYFISFGVWLCGVEDFAAFITLLALTAGLILVTSQGVMYGIWIIDPEYYRKHIQ